MTDQLQQQALEMDNINDAIDLIVSGQPAEQAEPEETVETVETEELPASPPEEEAVTETTTTTEEPEELSLEQQVEGMSDSDLNVLADKLVEQGGEVPAFVVKKLRKQKAEAKEELSEKGSKLDATLNDMTTVLEKLSQNQVAPTPETSTESDMFNSEEFSEAMTYEPEKATKMIQDQMKSMQDQMKSMQEQSAISQLQVTHSNIEQQARKRDVDYDAKKIKFIELEVNNLKMTNSTATPAQLQSHAENTFNTLSMEYLLQGQDPTIILDNYFKNTGIEFKQAETTKRSVDIDAIASSISKHQTLGGKSGKMSQGIKDMTLSKLSEMHPDKIQDWGKKYANHLNSKKTGKKVTGSEALDIFMHNQADKAMG